MRIFGRPSPWFGLPASAGRARPFFVNPCRTSSISIASSRARAGRWRTRKPFCATWGTAGSCWTRVHRLPNPSELLKIAADYHPETKLIATGSSSLGASRRFRDTLTDRKRDLWLTPMLVQDEQEFGGRGLDHRFRFGGLPPFYLAEAVPERGFQDWIESYWARDIQELFQVGRRWSFLRFVELMFTQSGGMFEATRFAAACEVSRTTIANYLQILEDTLVIQVIGPTARGVPPRSLRRRRSMVLIPGSSASSRGGRGCATRTAAPFGNTTC